MKKVIFNCAVIVNGQRYKQKEEIEVSKDEAKKLVDQLGKRVSVVGATKKEKEGDDTKDVLKGINKDGLVELCEKAELDTDGTVADLKARLEGLDDLTSLLDNK